MVEFLPYDRDHRWPVLSIFESNVGAFFSTNERSEISDYLDSIESGRPGKAPEAIEHHEWVMVDEGEYVGFGGIEIMGEAAYLSWGMVHASRRGHGLGAELLKYRIDWIKRERPEVKSLFVDTSPQAAGFFEKFGFVEQGRRPLYWGGEGDLVALELSFDGEYRFNRRVKYDGSIGVELR